MAYQLRIADPRSDEQLPALLDGSFRRQGRESRLVRVLADNLPTFDPGLSLVATEEERDVAFALFLPRHFYIRGSEVPLVISSPVCALPEVRGKGAARFLLDTGLAALRDRSIAGAMVLGGSGFFSRLGYRGAFNLYTIDAQRKTLEGFAVHGDAAWGGLGPDDIPHLAKLYTSCYRTASGSEVRSLAPIDWESSGDSSFTVVHRREGVAVAYLRFRLREKLEIMECGALDAGAVDVVIGFIYRIAGEHNRSGAEVHLPPSHPVFRALFRAGCMAEGNNFHDEGRLLITDWQSFLTATGASFASALRRTNLDALSLGIETHVGRQDWTLERRSDGGLDVTPGRTDRHLDLPDGWAEPLMTGRLDWRDLEFELGGRGSLAPVFDREFLSLLFPPGTPMWTYSPVLEIAYE